MDEMCNKSEIDFPNKNMSDKDVSDNVKRCGSPVFKCVNHTKAFRGNNLDSSDYDIPSYQINQSAKSKISCKNMNETNESVLLFSPIFSPLPTATTAQIQPPSIHSVDTVSKNLNNFCKSSGNSLVLINQEPGKCCGLFESLGMNEKDISWVSSMASPPPKLIPGSQFNTVEKATFLPEEKFQNIQPRALFSPNLDDDFGCHPISFCSESEDEEAYKSNIRLSDVCATLRQLEVKSLDLLSDQITASDVTLQEDNVISPVVRTEKKKPESVRKRKKGVLVVSPNDKEKYEFLLSENEMEKHSKTRSSDGNESNFIEDDSFQSMSFSGIDELCKTLVEDKNSSAVIKPDDCDKTLSNNSSINPVLNIPKIFYDSKASAAVYEVSSVSNLHSYAKALEEGNCSILASSNIEKSFVEKGIVRFDVLSKDCVKMESGAVKGQHSGVIEEKDKSENEWEKMKEYLSESQLNVSDGEIFRTVENLERTLASQESKGKLNELQETKCSLSQKSDASTSSIINSGRNGEEEWEYGGGKWVADSKGSEPWVGFRNVVGWRISVSKEALERGKKLFSECDEECERLGGEKGKEKAVNLSDGVLHEDRCDASGMKKERGIRSEGKCLAVSLEKASEENGEEYFSGEQESVGRVLMGGFSTGSGKKIKISAEALEKAKIFMRECDVISSEMAEEEFLGFSACGQKVDVGETVIEKNKTLEVGSDSKQLKGCEVSESGWGKGFVTISEKVIQKSPAEQMVEKAQLPTSEHDKNTNEESGNVGKCLMNVFSTCSGRKMTVSATALEKAKALMMKCEESCPQVAETVGTGFSTCSGRRIEVSAGALEKAKALMKECDENSREKFESVKRKSFLSDCDKTTEDSNVSLKGFTTCSGKKISVSSEALERAKAKMSDFEFEFKERSDQRKENGESVFFSESGFALSGALGLNKKESKSGEIFEQQSAKTETEVDKFEMTKSLAIDVEEEWDEIIPSWLHVYTTSPSVASDRTELSPVVVEEDGHPSAAAREYVLKSPVLGASDRFYGRRKRRRLRFEEEKTVSGLELCSREGVRKKGVKRRSGLGLDFSVAFKRARGFEGGAAEGGGEVEERRARRREEQEKAVLEKKKVKPSKGLHLRRKTSEKQVKWLEAVGGSPPEILSEEKLRAFGVHEHVLRLNIKNALLFTFNEDFFGSNVEGISAGDECILIPNEENEIGVTECKRGLLASAGVQPNLVPEGWVENHYKWIVWKLAHYERSFPQHFARECLTPDNVMLQLKYRYDREIDGSERSALKKILERDDTSAKRLVLCVCGIEKTEASEGFRYELSLTDGWYSCPARADSAMTRILEEGKLTVGTKLMTQGAVLVNCEQGISPLEIGENVHLRISTNSTRRVRWDTKLGFQKNPQNFPISLGSILARGGPISRIDVIIVRVYPLLYMEKTSDGSHVTRNKRSEEKAESEYRKLQEQKMEALCDEVRMEMKKSVNSEKKSARLCLSNLEQVEDLCEFVGSFSDPSALQEAMTPEHRKTLETFHANRSDHWSRRISEKIEKKLEKENLRKRNVSEFFRAKIVDLRKPDYNNPAVLSVWQPSEDLINLLSEGKVISLTNVTLSNSSRGCKPLQINTTRQTQYLPIARSVKYPARRLTALQEVSSKASPAFEEVDVVGVVVSVRDICHGSRLSQVAYLADSKRNFVGVVFWGSCKDYGWENVLKVQSIIACSNLQWKKNFSLQQVPSLYVNENSLFTENPKQSYMKEEMEKLQQNLTQNMKDFLSKCDEDLLVKLEDSKWRSNCSTNSSSIENPENSGKKGARAGFESRPTASSTPIKPLAAKRTAAAPPDDPEPSPIQKRIQRLQSYGEPPSLLPLLLRNNLKRRNNSRRKTSSLTTTSR